MLDINPQLGHIGLNVTDLSRSCDFYREVLGFSVISQSDETGRKYAFLGTAGTLLLTLWEQAHAGFDGKTAGLHHLAFKVESIELVKMAEGAAKSRGAKIFHDGIVAHREGVDSGGIFLEDPDGTRIEISTGTGAAAYPAPSGTAPTCGFF
jgi:catechol 2,3-dioxygenase-like lactoylglutathione lyase family enzyme/predicted pyridoxine 5'-phosphate oxidase superfamily flavin-nucleotide-binding protein